MADKQYDPTRDPHLATWKERGALGIKKMRCPACGRDGYKPYIYPDGQIVADDCGKCDHESSCGYHLTPREWFKQHGDQRGQHENKSYAPPPPPTPIRIPSEMVSQCYCMRQGAVSNPLLRYWVNLFNSATDPQIAKEYIDKFLKALKDFAIGSMPGNKTVFWIVDETGWIRSGKAMSYKPNGHRDKDDPHGFSWIHKYAGLYQPQDPDAEYVGCLYGLHQLKDKPTDVCIVESEKTALMMTVFRPDLCWMATMGMGNLNHLKLAPLIDRGIAITLFPDYDGFDKWTERAKEIRKSEPKAKLTVSDYIRKAWMLGDSPQADILDITERDFKLQFLP